MYEVNHTNEVDNKDLVDGMKKNLGMWTSEDQELEDIAKAKTKIHLALSGFMPKQQNKILAEFISDLKEKREEDIKELLEAIGQL